jgi:hypothetical protein
MREYRDDDIVFWIVRWSDYLTCNNHSHVIVHVLDDLEGCVDARGFGEGFQEGNVAFLGTRIGSIAFLWSG